MDTPITPEQAEIMAHANNIPEGIISCFNLLILKNYSVVDHCARFEKKELVKLIAARLNVHKEEMQEHWFDVKDVYEAAGWVFETPYEGVFELTKKGKDHIDGVD